MICRSCKRAHPLRVIRRRFLNHGTLTRYKAKALRFRLIPELDEKREARNQDKGNLSRFAEVMSANNIGLNA